MGRRVVIAGPAVEVDAAVRLRRARMLETRIAVQAVDVRVPGARRYVDDPLVARRLDEARRLSETAPARYVECIERLACDTLGGAYVERLSPPDYRAARRPQGLS